MTISVSASPIGKACRNKSATSTNVSARAASRSRVVLTDMGMPYVDGRKVASAIKQTSAHTPVILLTGWGQRLVGNGAPEHVDYVLGKPPKLRDLRQALMRAARGEAPRAGLQT